MNMNDERKLVAVGSVLYPIQSPDQKAASKQKPCLVISGINWKERSYLCKEYLSDGRYRTRMNMGLDQLIEQIQEGQLIKKGRS